MCLQYTIFSPTFLSLPNHKQMITLTANKRHTVTLKQIRSPMKSSTQGLAWLSAGDLLCDDCVQVSEKFEKNQYPIFSNNIILHTPKYPTSKNWYLEELQNSFTGFYGWLRLPTRGRLTYPSKNHQNLWNNGGHLLMITRQTTTKASNDQIPIMEIKQTIYK